MNDQIEEHIPLVHSIVNKFYIPQGLERDDLVQAGLIGIWKAQQKYKSSKNVKFGTYAYVIARNEILQLLRKHSKYREETIPIQESYLQTQQDVETLIEHKHIKEDLEQEERIIMDLLYQGYTQREIAKVLNTTQPSVCQRIRRLRVKGKRKWGEIY